MQNLKNIAIVVLVVLTVVVVLQNTAAVETKLLFMTVTMPRALLLIVTLLIGVVVGLLLGTKLVGRGQILG